MNVCVFCGSSMGRRAEYQQVATALGKAIAKKGYGLVYGGASVGLMGAVADGALKAGGEVIGILPKSLAGLEIAHSGLTELKIVSSMHERKALMAELSNAFIAMPGGIGTLEEAFEIWTWTQLGLHRKPLALLNTNGFYNKLAVFLDHIVAEQFVKPDHRDMLIMESDPHALINQLVHYDPPYIKKWIDKDAT